MICLIPSYEPDVRLLQLIHDLKESSDMAIVIVDDGSGEAYSAIFNEARAAGCIVLSHEHNRGKGQALKTGFRFIQSLGGRESVVCADSDGQHLPRDIERIAAQVREHPGHIVMGGRRFTGKVPLRSRFGNAVTRKVFRLTTGIELHDTQTGLRGFSSSMLGFLCSIPGDRFEYEMNMLLAAHESGIPMIEIPIDTVYLNENKSSHFRPLVDSIKIYFPILKFSGSSALSAGIDFMMLFLLQWMTGNLLIAVVGARLCSSLFNYSLNRKFVFKERNGKAAVAGSMPKYFTLVVLILVFNYGLMLLFNTEAGLPLLIAKVLTEGILFLFSYWSQRRFVYQ